METALETMAEEEGAEEEELLTKATRHWHVSEQ